MIHIAFNSEADREEAHAVISSLELGQGMWLEINDKPRRSGEQHRLYWSWLRIIQQETGEDLDALHEFFKRKFLGIGAMDFCLGELLEVPVSTTKLSVPEMTEYLQHIEAFAATELDIKLPSPDEDTR